MKNTLVMVLGCVLVSGCGKRPGEDAPSVTVPEQQGAAAMMPPCETTDRARATNLDRPTPPHLVGIPHVDPRLEIKPAPEAMATFTAPVRTERILRAQRAYLERAEQLKRDYPDPAQYEQARAMLKDQMLGREP